MAEVNKVTLIKRFSKKDIIRLQLNTHCFISKVIVSEADLDCLTLLAISGDQDLSAFCQHVSDEKIFRTTQTVRNAISKAEKKKLLIKTGKSKKRISIHPGLNIQTAGNIILDYTFGFTE